MAKGCGKQTLTPAAQAKMSAPSPVRQRYAVGTTQQPPSPKLVKR